MRRFKTVLSVAVAVLVMSALPAAAMAATGGTRRPHRVERYVPRHDARCRRDYRRVRVRVRERRRIRVHGDRRYRLVTVRRVECVRRRTIKRSRPTAPVSAPAPTIQYSTSVDPSFAQSATNPLAVTYSYSADATQSVGGQVTNLASTGQLPAGVLEFYSSDPPESSGEALICSINVGGAVTGGTCPVTYSSTGVKTVTTTYIPDASSAVTETDAVNVEPYGTTTTESVASDPAVPCTSSDDGTMTQSQCGYVVTIGTADQNGNAPDVGSASLVFTGVAADGDTLGYVLHVPAGQKSCHVNVAVSVADNYEQDGWLSQSDVSSSDCPGSTGWTGGNHDEGPGVSGNDVESWGVTAEYSGSLGWDASASGPQTVTP